MSDSVPVPTHSPEPAEVIRNALEDALKDTHVSNPATILKYDANTQLAQVQPLLLRPFVNDDGTVDVEAAPVINNVPVFWPAGGGFRLTFPLAAGDIVGLIFTDQSLDIWKAKGGQVDPIDQRMHHLSDCWALPQLRGKAAWTAVSADHVQLGKDGSAEEWVATAQRTLTQLQAITSAFNLHTHGINAFLTALTTALNVIGPTPLTGTSLAAVTSALEATAITDPGPEASVSAPASSTVGILG